MSAIFLSDTLNDVTFSAESDELINKKVHAAFEFDLDPMLCVGELLADRESGKSEAVCKHQTIEGLKGITAEQMKKVVIGIRTGGGLSEQARLQRLK